MVKPDVIMKYFILIITAIILISCNMENVDDEITSENIATEEEFSSITYYGDIINEEDVINTDELISTMADNDSVHVKVKTKIKETCSRKGCWMDVDLANGSTMTVRFKDYGFFVPTEGAVGKTTIFEGMAYIKTISVETLQHKGDDAGKDATIIKSIVEPEHTLVFEASGVIIKY